MRRAEERQESLETGKIPSTTSSTSVHVSAGDVSISIVKGKPAESQNLAKAAKPASVDAEDDDEHNELEVDRTGESIFDMMGVDSLGSLLPSWKKKTLAFVDGVSMSIIMTLLTILVLFLDDVRLACFPPSSDDAIVIVTIICLICFSIELGMNSAAKPGYVLGFYFWLDFVSTLSLLGDIPQFIQAVTGHEAGDSGGVDDSTTLARAGRTSRAGTRAGRIARVMRLIRLVRLVKLYRHFESNKDPKNTLDAKRVENNERDVEESRVGQKLSDLTTRRVIIGVLGMLFILPFFEIDAGIYGENSSLSTSGLEMIHEMALASGTNSPALSNSLEVFEAQVEYSLGARETSKLLSLLVTNVTLLNIPHENRRPGEVTAVRFISEACEDGNVQAACLHTEAVYDMKWYSQMNALLNIGRTLFIILVLGFGALLFSNDANVLVLRPLERMIQKVREISENPLARQAVIQDVDKEDSKLETRVLENSIMKICSLLAVGFGDAGAEVIAENMKKAGALDPMVPGRKMVAIFGFCDIRQFTDTTEVLQEEVMKFVNNIAQIVHTEVALHGGAANKNIGDAFLLVWKFPRGTRAKDLRQCTTSGSEPDLAVRKTSTLVSDQLESQASGQPLLSSLSRTGSMNVSFSSLPFARLTVSEKRKEICRVADNALASFIIIHAALKRTADIQKYSLRDDLNKRMPNFAVKMGFGLHVGWAIEGAIGSEYKVDASYLSPNVNMASRLEAATKQFGTSILLSNDFVRCLSQQVRSRVRQIDCVTVKGSLLPMGLYTFDISLERIPEAIIEDQKANDGSEMYTSFSRVEYENEWDDHPDLSVCWALDYEFMDKFSAAYELYTNGKWDIARAQLEECRTHRKSINGETIIDGPSVTLLEFMASHNYLPPKNWEGFRELTEK